jgi:hypothetical protein
MLRGLLPVALFITVLLCAPLPALADVADAQALSSAVIQSANSALEQRLGRDQVAQAKPVGEVEHPLRKLGLPLGLSYTLDASIAYPFGDITGGNQQVRLPGGIDATLGYGLTPHVRVQAGYFVVQEYPIGFSTGTVPVYLQGLSAPIATTSLVGTNDATVRNAILVLNLQTLVQIGKLPIVITPTYVARTGTIGGHSDVETVEINGFPQQVNLRTFQYKVVAFTIPFLSTPKMFGTYTIAPQWLVHTSGANTDNSAKLFQLLYLEYRANAKTTFFIQPSLLQNYTPVDYYAGHIPTLIYGFSYKFDRLFYMQGQVETGTPTNPHGGIGITAVTCQQLPCAPNQIVPTIGGLKASQVQLMLGIGKPQVVPL